MMKTKTKIAVVLLSLAALGLTNCGGGTNSQVEQAQFDLDKCNPTLETSLTNCQAAINIANSIRTTQPTNLDAAIILSSGELGLARADFLTLTADLADLDNNTEENGGDDFLLFSQSVATYEGDLNTDQNTTGLEIDLVPLAAARSAFDGLLTGITTDSSGFAVDKKIKQACFQAGMTQGLDLFVRLVKLSKPNAAAVLANIDAVQTALVLSDFINGDSNLVLGGTTKNDILEPIRQNYCRCSLQNPLGGTAGFSQTCIQDLMLCELYLDPASPTDHPQQDYNRDGLLTMADCTVLKDPAQLTPAPSDPTFAECSEQNTESN
jgi:hypothetical protein